MRAMLTRWQPRQSLLTDFLEDDMLNWLPARVRRAESANVYEPRIDVRENAKEFLVQAEIPGLDKDDFELSVEGNTLTLRGEKRREKVQEGEQYYRCERGYGAFVRTLTLGEEIDRDHIKAEYKKGVLNIYLPKSEKVKPREIAIEEK
jgi:HSP20 family protein